LFIASGVTRPHSGNETDELASTSGLISHFNFPKKMRIVYVSSGAVYGECSIPKTERDIPKPSTLYGNSKLKAENNLRSRFGNQVTSLRVGNVIDADKPYGIFSLLNLAIEKRSLELFGDPSDCRDYIGIADFLMAITNLISQDSPQPVMNVGSGKSLMLSELVSLLDHEMEEVLPVIWNPRRPGNLAKSQLNVRKMIDELGVQPTAPSNVIRDFLNKII
jgi:nucleoside-diphosphate-sugar epimerase